MSPQCARRAVTVLSSPIINGMPYDPVATSINVACNGQLGPHCEQQRRQSNIIETSVHSKEQSNGYNAINGYNKVEQKSLHGHWQQKKEKDITDAMRI